jgi:hypothetical protein
VTFRYKKECESRPGGARCGRQALHIRYEVVNAVLLNEFLKEHSKVSEQGEEIAELKAIVTELKSIFEKVNARQKAGQSAPRLAETR